MPNNPAPFSHPALLVILDGFGANPDPRDNAVALASTPNFDRYFANFPNTSLEASGRGVGLPEGQMGNSEVGHMTLGSGTIVRQDLVRIDDAIADGSFFENPALLSAVQSAGATNRPLQLMGLVSDGGVHSHIEHLKALIQLCHRHSVIAQLHVITDGRDTAPQTALSAITELDAVLAGGGSFIGTLSGRYYAMDRDQRWERVKLAWDNVVYGTGEAVESAEQAILASYAQTPSDEFIKPAKLPGWQPLQAGDEMVFFNFRSDRARQICSAFAADHFDRFDRGAGYCPIAITTMTYYGAELASPVAFSPVRPLTTLGSVISEAGLKQLHCAETEKYAHVTFFFNGGREPCYLGEERKLIPSPGVATYDLQPEMSAPRLADEVIASIESGDYPFVVVNFANGDMVGHTAVRNAVIEAVEVLDREVSRVIESAIANGYAIVLTADHGNCDEMVNPITGKPHTQHSVHPVPCLVIDDRVDSVRDGGNLSAIAPTILDLMGLAQPGQMTGRSLINNNLSDQA